MEMQTKSIHGCALMLLGFVAATAGCRDESGGAAAAVAETAGVASGGESAPTRRLWSGTQFNFFASSPSPDGRYVTEIDWASGDLAVRDLVTGRLHHLTDKGSWDRSGEYAEGSIFSPDGRRVAYVWFNETSRDYEVRVMDFIVDRAGKPRGSDPITVYPGGPLLAYWLYGWSASEEILVGLYRPDKTTALGLLSLETGALRVLKSFDWRDARAMLSGDGQFVAFDHPPDADSADREIRVVSVDGSREAGLVQGPGNHAVLGWVPGDAALLYYSELSGVGSVWRLPMAEGAAAGPAELVMTDVPRPDPLGIAGDDLYFGVTVDGPKYRTGTIDPDARQLSVGPVSFDTPDSRTIRTLAWSPDGQHVVHDAGAPVGIRIFLRRADGQPIGEWSFDVEMPRRILRWAPDGESVLLPAVDRGRDFIYRLDLASGELRPVLRFSETGESDRSFSISRDGRSLYFARVTRRGLLVRNRVEIMEHDIETGAERSIHRVTGVGPVVPSPDGEWVAWFDRTPRSDATIRAFPLDGGQPRILNRVDTGRLLGLIDWTRDSRWLLFTVARDTAPGVLASAFELWRVSRDGGDAERIAELPNAASSAVALHPDGRTIAWRAGRPRGEIWAMDVVRSTGGMESGGSGAAPPNPERRR